MFLPPPSLGGGSLQAPLLLSQQVSEDGGSGNSTDDAIAGVASLVAPAPAARSVTFALPDYISESTVGPSRASGPSLRDSRGSSSLSIGSEVTTESAAPRPAYRSSMRWGVTGDAVALAAETSLSNSSSSQKRKRFPLAVRFEGLSLTLKGKQGVKVSLRGSSVEC
jgi:hypothetical protein